MDGSPSSSRQYDGGMRAFLAFGQTRPWSSCTRFTTHARSRPPRRRHAIVLRRLQVATCHRYATDVVGVMLEEVRGAKRPPRLPSVPCQDPYVRAPLTPSQLVFRAHRRREEHLIDIGYELPFRHLGVWPAITFCSPALSALGKPGGAADFRHVPRRSRPWSWLE